MMYSYVNKLNWRGEFIKKNEVPFWKQILQNTCCSPYDLNFPDFDRELLKTILNKFLSKYGINCNLPYIIVDNSDSEFSNCDKVFIHNPLSEENIKKLATSVFHKKYQVIILHGFKLSYAFPSNVFKLPSWYSINSNELMSLLLNAYAVYSSDPNVYLSAGLLGCNKIYAASEKQNGFSLNDVEVISLSNKNKKWINEKDVNIQEFINII